MGMTLDQIRQQSQPAPAGAGMTLNQIRSGGGSNPVTPTPSDPTESAAAQQGVFSRILGTAGSALGKVAGETIGGPATGWLGSLLGKKIGGGIADTGKAVVDIGKVAANSDIAKGYMDLINKAGDNTMKQYTEAGKKMASSVTEAAPKIAAAGQKSDINKEGAAMGEAALGTDSGAVQGVLAPITGIIQAIADKASDPKAVQDFALGKGGQDEGTIYGLMNKLGTQIDEISKQHPEAATNIGDAANVLLATLGGERPEANLDLAQAKPTLVKSVKDVVGGPPGGGGGALETILGKAKAVGSDLTTETGVAGKKIGDILTNATKHVSTSASEQIPMTAKGMFSKIYRLSPETADFLYQHPEYADHAVLSKQNIFNESKAVEAKIAEERAKLPSSENLAEEVKQAAAKKSGVTLSKAPKPEELGKEIQDAIIRRKQELRKNAMKYPTGSLSPANTEKGLVKVDKNWLRDQLESRDVAGVDIEKNGRIAHGDAYSKINPSDSPNGAQILQNLWDTYGREFAKGQMSRAMFIKFRQSLARMANYRGGVDTVVEKVADKMRDNFNEAYRKQIPNLQNLDTTHNTMSKDLDRLSKGLTVEDPHGRVQLQEGTVAKIMNATKDTKSDVAKQIEELVPGITSKIKAIENANAEANRLTQGLIDERGNLVETAEGKIAGANAPGKSILAKRLEELVPGIGKRIAQMKQFNDEWKSIVDEGGNLRENALLNIKNSLNAGRDIRLERLEKLIPGITERLKLIHAADEFHSAMKGLPGNYVGAGVISQMFTGNPILGFLGAFATQPNVGIKILKALGERGRR